MANEYDAEVDKGISGLLDLASKYEQIEKELTAKLNEVRRARQRLVSGVQKAFVRESAPTSVRSMPITQEYDERLTD